MFRSMVAALEALQREHDALATQLAAAQRGPCAPCIKRAERAEDEERALRAEVATLRGLIGELVIEYEDEAPLHALDRDLIARARAAVTP